MGSIKRLLIMGFSIMVLVSCNDQKNEVVEVESIDDSIEMLASVFQGPYTKTIIKENNNP